MADNDDVNKSKNIKPVNGNPDDYATRGIYDIERILSKSERSTGQEVVKSKKLAEHQNVIANYSRAIESGNLPSWMIKDLQRERARSAHQVIKIEDFLSTQKVLKQERTINELGSSVYEHFSSSSVNGYRQDIGRTILGQEFGRQMMSLAPEELEKKRARSVATRAQLEQQAINLIDRAASGDFRAQQELQAVYKKHERQVKFEAGIDVAERRQRSAGLDVQSQEEKFYKRGAQFRAEIKQNEIKEDIASGKIRADDQALANLNKQEIELKRQFLAEQEKLKTATGEAATKIRSNLGKLSDAIEENSEKISQIEQAKAEQGQGRSNLANNLNLLGSGFGAIGGAAQALLVNQRMQQMQNVASYAEFENLKYQTYKKANAGDVMSQLLLSGFKSDEGFGTELRAGQISANAANIVGSGLQVTAGTIRATHAGLQEINPAAQAFGTAVNATQNLQAGMMDVIGGTASLAVQAGDAARGISAGQADISGRHLSLQARRALLAIGAEQLQGLRDFGVDMGTAAMSMGGAAGSAFLQRNFSRPNMERMRDARISPEQMAQMSAFGVQEIGSTFNEEQIYAARGLERSGFGSMQTNMQRMASLAAAGANNPDSSLKSVLEAAFSKSLEGSKVLNEMVEYTGAMASQSVGRQMGLDVTAEAAQLLSAGVDPNAKNKEVALSLAATSAEKMRQISTDTGVNYSAMAATARISKMTGLSGDEAILAQKMDDATLRKLRNSSPNEIRKQLFEQGIDVKEGKEKELVDNLMKARLITNLQMGGAGIALGIDAEALADKVMRGEKLSSKEQLQFNKAANFAGVAIGSQALRTATGITNEEPNAIGKEKAGKALRGDAGDELMKTLDDMRTQGFKQLSAAALEATAGFKNATEALKSLGLLAKESENAVDQGAESKFKTAAAKSAGSLGKDTVIFNESVNTFSLAVDKLVKMSDMSKGDNAQALLNSLLNRNYTKLGSE